MRLDRAAASSVLVSEPRDCSGPLSLIASSWQRSEHSGLLSAHEPRRLLDR